MVVTPTIFCSAFSLSQALSFSDFLREEFFNQAVICLRILLEYRHECSVADPTLTAKFTHTVTRETRAHAGFCLGKREVHCTLVIY
jgi:hypothetical protein